MSVFVGTVLKNRINTAATIQAFVDRCNMTLEITDGSGTEVREIKRGDMIIDPVSDDEVRCISATGNGFWVEDRNGERYLMNMADTILANV